MRLRTYDVVREPRGAVLSGMLRVLASMSSSVLMVVRDDLGLDDAAVALLGRLEGSMIEQRRSGCWPGTELMGEEATVYRFALSDAVVDEVLRASPGLYGWQQPALPEDLALVRSDGSVVLGTISHERDAFLKLGEQQFAELCSAVPGIVNLTAAR